MAGTGHGRSRKTVDELEADVQRAVAGRHANEQPAAGGRRDESGGILVVLAEPPAERARALVPSEGHLHALCRVSRRHAAPMVCV